MIKLKNLLIEQSTLRQGMRDKKIGTKEGPIAVLQDKLIQLGHMKKISDSDYGIYGPQTKAAVTAFQIKAFPGQKKEHDGIAGSKTLDALTKSAVKPSGLAGKTGGSETEEDPARRKTVDKMMTKKAISILTANIVPDFVLQFLFPTPMTDSDFAWYDRRIMGAVIKNHIKYQNGNPIKDSIGYGAYDAKILNLLDGPGGFDAAKFGQVFKTIISQGVSGAKLLLKLKMALLFGRFTYQAQKDGTYNIIPDPYDFSKGGSIKNMPTEKEVEALRTVSGGEGFMFQLRLIQLLMAKNSMFKGKVKAASSGIDNLKALGKSLIDDGFSFSFGEWYRTMRALRSVTDPGIVGSGISRNAMAMSDITAPGIEIPRDNNIA